jgi:tetratricopeptide (TPR) repeat protein
LPFLRENRSLLAFVAWIALIALAWLAYRPGLSGPFLFDDFVNLPALGETGPVDDWPTFWRYVTSGIADPTGRPLAMASFLLDARDWPADPASFLRTNLLLHLANGSLLFLLLDLLGRRLGSQPADSRFAAGLGAGLWMLHPLFVSTTLYAVQREAMLPTTFILLALLGYARGRLRYEASAGASGLWLMAVSLTLGTVLATLSKANGILLPLLAWVVEATVFHVNAPAADRRLRLFRWIFLCLPSIALLLWLLQLGLDWNYQVSRPFTIGQRVLTEPRVLVSYLALLFVPRSVSTGLFNDSFSASTSLLEPATTLPCLLAVLALFGLGLVLRRRMPALSLAILFFFAGHALESTTVPLELYFEHRNYLPALLLFWPLARALAGARIALPWRFALAGALLLICAATTWQRASIWGDPKQLSRLWALRNPDSSRAQASAAIDLINAGHGREALALLDPQWRRKPEDLQIALNYISAACTSGGLRPDDARRLAWTLEHARQGSPLVRNWLENAIYLAKSHGCAGLDFAVVQAWLDASLRNPMLAKPDVRERSMMALRAILSVQRNDPDAALADFNRALAAAPSPEVAAGQAALLAEEGHYRHALRHLDTWERMPQPAPRYSMNMSGLHGYVLDRQQYWPRELAILRQRLQRALAEDQRNPEP